LHALLSIWMGDERATDIAATIGQACAFGLGFLGLAGNPLLLFVAIFVYMAASEEAHYSHLRHALAGLTVADVMETRALNLPYHATLRDAVELLRDAPQSDFPVVDAFGKPVGIASRSAILVALQKGGDPDAAASLPQTPAPTIRANVSAQKALETFSEANAAALCAVDADGGLVGLLPKQALIENMLIRAARPDWRFTRRA
jgi:CBS-domain-containing membrane protein